MHSIPALRGIAPACGMDRQTDRQTGISQAGGRAESTRYAIFGAHAIRSYGRGRKVGIRHGACHWLGMGGGGGGTTTRKTWIGGHAYFPRARGIPHCIIHPTSPSIKRVALGVVERRVAVLFTCHSIIKTSHTAAAPMAMRGPQPHAHTCHVPPSTDTIFDHRVRGPCMHCTRRRMCVRATSHMFAFGITAVSTLNLHGFYNAYTRTHA